MPLSSSETFKGLPFYLTIPLIILFFYLPGYLIWKLILIRSEKFRKFCNEEYGFWSSQIVKVVISILITGWTGFVLGEAGIFRISIIAGVLTFLCIILFFLCGAGKIRKYKGYRQTEIKGTIQDDFTIKTHKSFLDYFKKYVRILKNFINLILLRNEIFYIPLLLIIAAIVFTKPIHNVWRGKRDGADSICGIRLARTGAFLSDEKILRNLNNEERKALFYEGNIVKNSERYLRFPSYFSLPAPDSNKSYPAFLHFYSTWLGISCRLVGIPNFYYITPLLAMIGTGIIFMFVNSLSSVKTAFLAVLLLTLNIAQIYFVRVSSSVIATQFFIFTGLYFFMVFSRTALKTFGFFSGIAFGQAVLCGNGMFQYLVLAGFLALCATYNPRKQTRVHYRHIILTFLLFCGQAILFDFLAGTNNIMVIAESLTRTIVGYERLGSWEINLNTAIKITAVFALLIIVISSVFVAGKKKYLGFIQRLAHFRNGLIIRTAGFIIVFAYIIRFYLTRPPYLEYYGGYVYPNKWIHKIIDELGLIFLIIGVIFFIYFRFFKKRHHMVYFPMFLFLIFSLENLWNPGTSSSLLYGFRKFLPLFLPYAYFMVAYALFAFRELTRELEFGRYFGGMIAFAAIVLILITGQNGLLLKKRVEGKSLSSNLFRQYEERMVSKIDKADINRDDAVIFFVPGTIYPLLPMTLTYVYDIQSIQLFRVNFEDPALPGIMEKLIDSGKSVFVVFDSVEETKTPTLGKLKSITFGKATISVPQVEETQGQRIRKIIKQDEDPTVLIFYQIVTPS